MHRHKLLKILTQLSSNERREFLKYFQNNYAKNQIGLEILRKTIKIIAKDTYDPASLSQKVLPNHFDSKRKSKELLKILKRLEDFLILRELSNDTWERNRVLLQVYRNKGMEELFTDRLQHLQDQLAEVTQPDMWHWYRAMLLAHQTYFNPYHEHRKSGGVALQEAYENLQLFHSAAYLRYQCEFLNRQKISGENIPRLSPPDPHWMRQPSSANFYHRCYELASQLIQKEEEAEKPQRYAELKQVVFQHLDQLQKRDQLVLLTVLLNYAAKRILEGDQSYMPESFELAQQGMQRDSFEVDGVLNESHFINFIDIASKLGEYVQAEEWLHQKLDKIRDDKREEVRQISEALILFGKKEYDTVQQSLLHFRSSSINIELRYRWLFLQSLYEIDRYSSTFLDACASYEKYVRRSKLPEQQKQSALNVVRFLRKLTNPDVNAQNLQTQLQNQKAIFLKSWLLQKIKEH